LPLVGKRIRDNESEGEEEELKRHEVLSKRIKLSHENSIVQPPFETARSSEEPSFSLPEKSEEPLKDITSSALSQ
jgi:hypothetical protein